MKNWSIKAERLRIPFKGSYEHNLAKRSKTDSTFLFVENDGCSGFGEACPRDYVTGESFETIKFFLDSNSNNLFNDFDYTLESIEAITCAIPEDQPNIKCLVETSLLMLMASNKKVGLNEIVGVNHLNNIPEYTAAYDASSDEQFKKMLMFYKKMEMPRAKLKIARDNAINISRIKVLKNTFAEALSLRLDGNEIYTFSENRGDLKALIDTGVKTFEQPFHRDDKTSHKKFMSEFGRDAKLIVDETVTSLSSARKALELDYISGVNLKISKNGGLFSTLKIAELFKNEGKSVRLGCHVGETSLLSNLGTLFCLLFPYTKDREGCFGTLLLEHDPVLPNLNLLPGGSVLPSAALPKYTIT